MGQWDLYTPIITAGIGLSFGFVVGYCVGRNCGTRRSHRGYENVGSGSENSTDSTVEQNPNELTNGRRNGSNRDEIEFVSETRQQSRVGTVNKIANGDDEDRPVTSPGEVTEYFERNTEINENVDIFHDVPPEAHNETEERQCVRSESDCDTEKTTDVEHDQALSTTGMRQQSDTEFDSAIHNDEDVEQSETVPGERMQGFEVKRISNENLSGNIIAILEGYTDLQLYSITQAHREQLESLAEDVVENFSESLLRGRWMTDLHHEEIRTLTRSYRRHDASKRLLQSLLDGNFWECRMFWKELAKMQDNQQSLIKLLTQSGERVQEVILHHRYSLQIHSKKLRDTYSQGNKMLRSRLIDDIYTNSKITLAPYEHDGGTEESKKHVREFQTHEILRINTDSDKTVTTVVCGAAGTGKSTMIQKIIRDWATKKAHENFKFVFHFRLQNLNANKCGTSLNTLILDQYPYFEDFLEQLWKEPKSILFIFDDLDQLDRSITSSVDERGRDPRPQCFGPDSYCFVSDIVRCLIHGDLVTGCSVLITTRPCKLETLRQARVDSTFQIEGFTSENVKEYFQRYFQDEQSANYIVQLVKQSDVLWNMCRNPLFCLVLTSSLEYRQSKAQTPVPVINHTQVLSEYVILLLEKCGYDQKTSRNSLLELGQFAYKQIAGKTFSFEVHTLKKLNYCSLNFISAFMIEAPDKESGGYTYKFTHSVMRDFFAALTKILTTSGIGLKALLDEAFADIDGRFNIFSRFIVGLCAGKPSERLELEVGSFASDATPLISQWLTESVKRRLPNLDGKYSQSMFLNILHCLLEFGDTRVTRDALEPIKTIKFNQCLLKPYDCVVSSRTLIHSEVIEELDLSSCHVQRKGIQQLDSLLHRCQILRLNENDLRDTGVEYLFNILNKNDCRIQTLELRSNQLTDDSLKELFSVLSKNQSLMHLDLSNSSQDGQHANQFTTEILNKLIEGAAQQKHIRWSCYRDVGQGIATSSTASNVLTIITD